MLTQEEVSRAMPPALRGSVSQSLVDALNNIQVDPEAAEAIRDNFLTYASVLKDGRYKMEDYLNAVAFVSFKLMNCTNREAYEKTFPQRYQNLVARGTSEKDISSYVSAYVRNKLVTQITEQSIIPSWILNQDAYQEAINTQFKLMTTAKSEKVRCDAANSILTHLKKPETKQVELSIDTADNSGLNELKKSLTDLAELQKELIQGGMSTRDVAHQNIIEAEVVAEEDQ